MPRLYPFLLAGILAVVAAFPARAENPLPADLEGHWSRPFVEKILARGILETGEGGLFQPEEEVPRGAMVAAVLRAAGVELLAEEEIAAPTFADVAIENENFLAIETAAAREIISGKKRDGQRFFAPEEPISRAAFLKILFLANKIPEPEKPAAAEFSDVPAASWAASWISLAKEKELAAGVGKGKFAPDAPLTRGQIAKILVLFEEKFPPVADSSAVEKEVAAALFERINADRQAAGKGSLVLSEKASAVAAEHARWLAEKGRRSTHVGKFGTSPFERLKVAGVEFSVAAENLGWATAAGRSPKEAALAIHAAMMAEPEGEENHRANLLSSFHGFAEIGIGVAISGEEEEKEVRVVEVFLKS